ncbi:MAG: transglycosylase family protein, partial [Acidimicrobiia bacterium]
STTAGEESAESNAVSSLVPSLFAPGWYARYQRLHRPSRLPQLRYSHLPSSRYVRAFRTRRPVLPPPRPAPVAALSRAPVPDNYPSDVWERLRRCESGGRYQTNSGNGYYGAYQFLASTWRSLGYPGLPHEASPEVQDEAARRLQVRGGWVQWGACSRRLGLR